MKILLVDDHALIRQGLKSTLAAHFPRATFGEAGNAVDAFQLLRKEKWDIVFLDIGLPVRDGIEVLKEMRVTHPQLPVLMLSMYPEEQFATRVLKAGAAGYLTKGSSTEEILDAMAKVQLGQKYVSPSLVQKLAFDLAGEGNQASHESLSDREYQVMCLLANGKTVSEISEDLFLSVKTVSTYRTHILRKMNMKTNADIMRYALHNRLVI